MFRHLMIAASDSKFPTPLTPCLDTVPARLLAVVTVQSRCHLFGCTICQAHTSLPSVVCRATRTWATHAAAGRSGHRRPPPPLRNSCQRRPSHTSKPVFARTPSRAILASWNGPAHFAFANLAQASLAASRQAAISRSSHLDLSS